VGFSFDGAKNLTQAKTNFVPKTLPYFVGDPIIKAQQLVCQEKNIILENISVLHRNFFHERLLAQEEQPRRIGVNYR
jgi:hypothetical protein